MNNNNQTSNSKMQQKPLFQEGTFCHTLFYGITAKVKAGDVSFAKVFWVGFLFITAVNVLILLVFEWGQVVKEYIEFFLSLIWARHLWFARKQVFHPAWFYVGFGIALLPILWFAIGFVNGFIPAFLAAYRG